MMVCWANRHTFTWGSSTAVDAMPLSLRCDCGAISREDIDPIRHLHAEVARLREGIQRYMADDPPHATDCASMDPYPAHGPCDCGVDEFVESALSTSGEPEGSAYR